MDELLSLLNKFSETNAGLWRSVTREIWAALRSVASQPVADNVGAYNERIKRCWHLLAEPKFKKGLISHYDFERYKVEVDTERIQNNLLLLLASAATVIDYRRGSLQSDPSSISICTDLLREEYDSRFANRDRPTMRHWTFYWLDQYWPDKMLRPDHSVTVPAVAVTDQGCLCDFFFDRVRAPEAGLVQDPTMALRPFSKRLLNLLSEQYTKRASGIHVVWKFEFRPNQQAGPETPVHGDSFGAGIAAGLALLTNDRRHDPYSILTASVEPNDALTRVSLINEKLTAILGSGQLHRVGLAENHTEGIIDSFARGLEIRRLKTVQDAVDFALGSAVPMPPAEWWRYLVGRNPRARDEAAKAMAEYGNVELLNSALAHESVQVRAAAAEAICQFKVEAVLPCLVSGLRYEGKGEPSAGIPGLEIWIHQFRQKAVGPLVAEILGKELKLDERQGFATALKGCLDRNTASKLLRDERLFQAEPHAMCVLEAVLRSGIELSEAEIEPRLAAISCDAVHLASSDTGCAALASAWLLESSIQNETWLHDMVKRWVRAVYLRNDSSDSAEGLLIRSALAMRAVTRNDLLDFATPTSPEGLRSDSSLTIPADASPRSVDEPEVPKQFRPMDILTSLGCEEPLRGFLSAPWEAAFWNSCSCESAAISDRDYGEAARLCDEHLKEDLAFEPLRRAIIANVAGAAAYSASIEPIARATMCLSAICHSPDLWKDGPLPVTLAKAVLAQGLRLLARLAESRPETQLDDSFTGGLTLADFIQAEDECARFVQEQGGVSVKSGQGDRRLAYGYKFACVFGAQRALELRARGLEAVRGSLFFTPLFGYSYLFRAGRYRDVVEHGFDKITDNGPWGAELAGIVISSALKVLESLLHISTLSLNWGPCIGALQHLNRYYSKRGEGFPVSSLGAIVERLLGELRSHELSQVEARQISEIFNASLPMCAERERLGREFRKVVGPQRARLAKAADNWDGVLEYFDDAEQCGYLLSVDELECKFEGLCHRFIHDRGALVAMKEVRELISTRMPQASILRGIDRALSEAELIVNGSSECHSLPEAQRSYSEAPTAANLLSLLLAARIEAAALMKEKGPQAVLDCLEALAKKCGACPPLLELPRELAKEWLGRFDPEDLTVLLSSSVTATPRVICSEPNEGQLDAGTSNGVAAKVGSDVSEEAAAEYIERPTYQNRFNALLAIRLRAADLMQNEGAETAANYLNGMRQRMPSLTEIASLPLDLAPRWLDSFPPEQISLFLELCAFHCAAVPVEISVQAPPAPVNPSELLSANILSEEDRVRSRLKEYEQHFRTTGGPR